MARVFVKKGRAQPLWYHHPWLFSGAIAKVEGKFNDGDEIAVFDQKKDYIGWGVINSKSKIMVRLYGWQKGEGLTREFLKEKIISAKRLRTNINSNAYRLINSEGDGVSGLIIDNFNSLVVVQFNALGLWQRRELIFEILEELLSPRAIFEIFDPQIAQKEGIKASGGLVKGEELFEIEIKEHGIKYIISLKDNFPKTGFFLDQRENRAFISKFCREKRVLDGFCFSGGFSLSTSILGKAKEVNAFDSSFKAISLAQRNAQLNGVKNIKFFVEDGFRFLKELNEKGERFDLVIIDPPKFASSRSHLEEAIKGYARLNQLSLQLIASPGYLLSFSCSSLFKEEDFQSVLREAALGAKREIKILAKRGAALDHPISPFCPKGEYLKGYLLAVS